MRHAELISAEKNRFFCADNVFVRNQHYIEIRNLVKHVMAFYYAENYGRIRNKNRTGGLRFRWKNPQEDNSCVLSFPMSISML